MRAAAMRQGSAPLDRAEVSTIVENVVTTLGGDLKAGDLVLYTEIEELACFIERARSEIAALRPDAVRAQHIPTATDELDAIVAATEQATNSIMASAETIESVAAGLPGEVGAKLVDAVTAIYEACGFQDITGQRIGKVVRALKHIEVTFERIIGTFGDGAASAAPTDTSVDDDGDPDKKLLNGPQLPTNAASQDDIDALFGDGR
jgi:chemotaxis protein CheZ